MRFKFYDSGRAGLAWVFVALLSVGQFEIMAMNSKTSTIIISEVHGHNPYTVCSSNSKPNIHSR
jgi:hypothetical protein